MGYTTDFSGEFELDRPLTAEHEAYLRAFSRTRRMARNPEITAALPDPIREAVGLPVGPQGAYYVGNAGPNFGQDHTPDVIDYNNPPEGQPGLWCQWIPSGSLSIVWDDGEKFYEYERWIEYLVEHFLGPWGYRLNGEVTWTGEDPDDRGRMTMTDNKLTVADAIFEYRDRE